MAATAASLRDFIDLAVFVAAFQIHIAACDCKFLSQDAEVRTCKLGFSISTAEAFFVSTESLMENQPTV